MQKIYVNYRRSRSRWHIRFRTKGRKEVIKSFSGRMGEKTIAQKADWYQVESDMGRFDPWEDKRVSSSLVIQDAIEEYCRSNRDSGNWSTASFENYTSRLQCVLAPVMDRKVSLLEKSDYESCLSGLDVAPVTKKGYISTLNSFLKHLHQTGAAGERVKCELNVNEKLEIRNDSKIKYLTWQQVDDICSATRFSCRQKHGLYKVDDVSEFYTDMYWFMFYSLLRKNEVSRIRNRDVLGSGDRLRVHGKGRKVDEIPLPGPAAEIIRKYWDPSDAAGAVFTTHMNRAYKHFRPAVKMALGDDHPSGFHQLRHGGVVHYLTMGKPIQFVSKLCRHANIQVTLTVYANIIPDGLAAAFSDVTHGPASKKASLRLVKGA